MITVKDIKRELRDLGYNPDFIQKGKYKYLLGEITKSEATIGGLRILLSELERLSSLKQFKPNFVIVKDKYDYIEIRFSDKV